MRFAGRVAVRIGSTYPQKAEDSQLANCRQCGAKLPSFTFGEVSPYCKTCRSQRLESTPETASTFPSATGVFLPPKADDVLPAQSIDERQTPATYLLLAINIVVFLAMLAFGISPIDPDTAKVLQWGADYGPYTLGGQYWRLITSMFLHFGIIHIFGNMWCLWSLGRLAERLLGALSVIGVYLLTGVGASLLSLSWDPMRVSAGASGAIFGIAGALITTLYFGKHNLPQESVRRLLGYVLRFSLLNLLFGLKGHVDNMAHLGGLVTGLLIGLFLARTFTSSADEQNTLRWKIMALSALVLLVLFVPVAKAKQYAVEFAKGQDALEHNDFKTAIPHLQKYVAARPDDPYGHTTLGSAFQQAHRFDEAAQEFERSLAIDPDDTYAEINLAKIYAYQKKTAKALELFKKSMPQTGDDAGASAFYLYAAALKDAGHLAEAENNIRKAVRLDPKDINAHRLLAEILALEDKKNDAAAEVEHVNQLTKDTPPEQPSK
jgi:rhomboid protease GluP